MPGTYAHITLVHFAKSRARTVGLSQSSEAALHFGLGALELGSVSPDYPYLSPRRDARKWADLMHYTRTSELLKCGAQAVQTLKGSKRERALAWLFGLAAHLAADATIHPVIEAKVGPYKYNKTRHRICEMHQDVYVFPRLELGDVGHTEHLRLGVAHCVDEQTGRLDDAISECWFSILAMAYPQFVHKSPPRPQEWHQWFLRLLSVPTRTNQYLPLARHVAARHGLSYPMDPAPEFLIDLPTPEGPMSYDAVFDRAIDNVLTVWGWLDAAIEGRPAQLNRMSNWNLDTGLVVGSKNFALWRI